MDNKQEVIEGEYLNEQDSTNIRLKANKRSNDSLVEKIVRFVENNPAAVTILEYIPSPIPIWGWGDWLGMVYAWWDINRGARVKGYLKMMVAVIPLLPTRIIHGVIDRIWLDDRK